MTFKIGDKVRFLNDVGGGVITAFIDEKMVEVQTEDGFEIPVLATELLLDMGTGFNGDITSPKSQPQAKPRQKPVEEAVKTTDFKFVSFKGSAFLGIVPENDALLHVSDLKLYLINDSNYTVHYIVSHNEGSIDELVKAGSLQPQSKQSIKKYVQSNLSKVKSLRLQCFFYKDGLMEHPPIVDKKMVIEGISFYKAASFKKSDYFKVNAVIFKEEEQTFDLKEAVEKLNDSEVIKVVKTKEGEKKEPDKKPAKLGIEEVDLHIEQILDDYAALSNGEIVEAQLARFETALETALNAGTPKIVFIHGVGNGRLKHELRKKLDRKYGYLRYQDASFKEYGYGATMVYLK